MMYLSHAKLPHEPELIAMFSAAHPTVGSAIQDARAAGIPFAQIISLLVQFGPKFVEMIRAVIDALNTPVPA